MRPDSIMYIMSSKAGVVMLASSGGDAERGEREVAAAGVDRYGTQRDRRTVTGQPLLHGIRGVVRGGGALGERAVEQYGERLVLAGPQQIVLRLAQQCGVRLPRRRVVRGKTGGARRETLRILLAEQGEAGPAGEPAGMRGPVGDTHVIGESPPLVECGRVTVVPRERDIARPA